MKSMIFSLFSIMLRLIIVAVAISFVIRAGKTAYSMGYRVFAEPAVSSGEGLDVTVKIPEGAGASRIGEILEDKGLIRDAKLFRIQERFSQYHGKIQSGTYTLNTAMTADEMISVMASDGSIDEEE